MDPALERPRFRGDLVAQPIEEDGVHYVDVTDPASAETFRFYDVEYSIACAMDGARSLAELIAWAQSELGIDTSLEELSGVMGTLSDLGYLEIAAALPERGFASDPQPEPLGGMPELETFNERTRVDAPSFDPGVDLTPRLSADLAVPRAETDFSDLNDTLSPDLLPPKAPTIEIDETEFDMSPPIERPKKDRVITREVPKFDVVARIADEAAHELDRPILTTQPKDEWLPSPGPVPPIESPLTHDPALDDLLDDDIVLPTASKVARSPLLDPDLPLATAPHVALSEDFLIASAEIPMRRASAMGADSAPEPPHGTLSGAIRIPAEPPAMEPLGGGESFDSDDDGLETPSRKRWFVAGSVFLLLAAGIGVGAKMVLSEKPVARPTKPVKVDKPIETKPVAPQAVVSPPSSMPTKAGEPPPAPDLPSAKLAEISGTSVEIRAKSAGRVQWVVVDGTHVAAGDIVATFVGSKKWEGVIRATTDRLHFYEKQLELVASVVGKEAQTKVAKAKIAEKKAIIEGAQKSLMPFVIRAPGAGVAKHVAPVGAMVPANALIVKLSSNEKALLATVDAGDKATGYKAGGTCVVAAKTARDRQSACVVDKVVASKVTVRLIAGALAKAGDEVVLLPPKGSQ